MGMVAQSLLMAPADLSDAISGGGRGSGGVEIFRVLLHCA